MCLLNSSAALGRMSTSLLSKEPQGLDLALNPLPFCREGAWLPAQSEQHLAFHTCPFSSTVLHRIHLHAVSHCCNRAPEMYFVLNNHMVLSAPVDQCV